MAILKIARMGHPVLRRAAEPIADPTASEVTALVGQSGNIRSHEFTDAWRGEGSCHGRQHQTNEQTPPTVEIEHKQGIPNW